MSSSNIDIIVDVMKGFLHDEHADRVIFRFGIWFEDGFCNYMGDRVTFFKEGKRFGTVVAELYEGKYYDTVSSSLEKMNEIIFSMIGKRWSLMRIDLDKSGKVTVCVSYDVPLDDIIEY